jgi:hypothetical protein
MGILFGNLAVRRPPGVANPGIPEIHRWFYGIGQILYSPEFFQHKELVLAQAGYPRRVIASVFQSLEAVDHNLSDILIPYVTYYAAHGRICLPDNNVLREKSFQKMARRYVLSNGGLHNDSD